MKCADCRWFQPLTYDGEKVIDGHCRRFPPQVLYDPDDVGSDTGTILALFPEVPAHGGCGEFVQAQAGDRDAIR